jgi:uncharacterized protein (DUF1501 family)
MAINRRQFIKRGAGAVSVSLIMPKLWMGGVAHGQGLAAEQRKIFVVIQLGGGWDGLNTVVPYTDSRYKTLRPTIGFTEAELKDEKGASTILGDQPFAFHPAMGELKSLYDAGNVGIVLGVGYPNQNLSHFFATDIWQTANTTGAGSGWLGRYADQKLVGQSGLSAVSIGGGGLPKAFYANSVVVPSIAPAGGADPFANYTFQTDPRYTGDRNNQINTFKANSTRSFPAGSFADAIADAGFGAEEGAAQLRTAVQAYTPGATYPTGNQPSATAVNFALALKMVAQIITTIPDANLLYVQLGGFDHHSQEIGTAADNFRDKTKGALATLLKAFSLGVKTFYDDLAAHGLADNVVMLGWSEFGRRPNENASVGTDHGTIEPLIVIGNAVNGGVYGQQPSLSDLDNGGNMKFKVDFRSVYATILDKWLGADSQAILGSKYENVGFLS